eukprot:scaffold20649_cov113-Isochrysis_galbana.AAC.6
MPKRLLLLQNHLRWSVQKTFLCQSPFPHPRPSERTEGPRPSFCSNRPESLDTASSVHTSRQHISLTASSRVQSIAMPYTHKILNQ